LPQDRKDGVPIPHLGGTVTVEELPVTKEDDVHRRRKNEGT
jgi:hypothetical protein